MMSSVLMRCMHHIFGRPSLVACQHGSGPPQCWGGVGPFVKVYCDDILIFFKTREEPLAHVHMVLETLRHHTLYAKASKRQFCRSSLGFLGHVISDSD